MSRLASEGWVTRLKVGRNSFCALTPLALAASEAASRRISQHAHSEVVLTCQSRARTPKVTLDFDAM